MKVLVSLMLVVALLSGCATAPAQPEEPPTPADPALTAVLLAVAVFLGLGVLSFGLMQYH